MRMSKSLVAIGLLTVAGCSAPAESGNGAGGNGSAPAATTGSGSSSKATSGNAATSGNTTGSGGGTGSSNTTGNPSSGATGTSGNAVTSGDSTATESSGSGGGAQSGTGGSSGSCGSAVTNPDGYAEIPDGRCGVNVERVVYTPEMGFDMATSLAAFQTTLYPLLRTNCSGCHSTENTLGSGAQAPIHSDKDVKLAHQYALTRVNFRSPADSKFVVRMAIDRHNCFGTSCKDAAAQMLTAVQAWANAVAPTLPVTPYLTPKGTQVAESQVLSWIQADKATVATADQPYIKYVSLHELQNAGVTADQLNIARVGISKALNSTARWATDITNPTEVAGTGGMVEKFDTRWYWAPNKGVTKLIFGGSDDDLFFGSNKTDYLGNAVSSAVFNQKYNFTKTVTNDPAHATLIWSRILAGNVEGAVSSGSIPANVNGFHADYIEAGQLVYTLTRPDVYNAIMMNPMYSVELEDELGVDKSSGASSYQYVVTHQAITVDSRLYFRAKATNGYFWKTFDIFTGQVAQSTIETAEAAGNFRFPFWANPIPKFISGTGGGVTPATLSFIATLAQPTQDAAHAPGTTCDGQANYGGSTTFYNCLWYTGESGLQQSAEEIIYTLPNGLQAYWLGGGFDQRRVDAFVNIVRDYRLLRTDSDAQINDDIGFAVTDTRLNTGSSCFGCHADGMNRGNNNMRDWLEEGGGAFPTGAHGVDSWINDDATKAQVRQLYPTSSVIRKQMNDDRRIYLKALAKITSDKVAGVDKNVYVEPLVWTVEWTQSHYKYQQTRSN